MPRADFLTSIVLVAIGLGAAIESWRMPRLQNLGRQHLQRAGRRPVPARPRHRAAGPHPAGALAAGGGLTSGGPLVAGDGARRFGIAAILTLGYAIVLVDWLPFWAATAIFVAAFVLIFEWQAGIGGASRARRVTAVAAFALATGLGVSVLFEDVFLVRLP
jgi:hypothetical protein